MHFTTYYLQRFLEFLLHILCRHLPEDSHKCGRNMYMQDASCVYNIIYDTL